MIKRSWLCECSHDRKHFSHEQLHRPHGRLQFYFPRKIFSLPNFFFLRQINFLTFIPHQLPPRQQCSHPENSQSPMRPHDKKFLPKGTILSPGHRDFSCFDSLVTIKLTPSRVEIWNPGSFPPGTNLNRLEEFRVSRPTNPDTAQVLHVGRKNRCRYVMRRTKSANRSLRFI